MCTVQHIVIHFVYVPNKLWIWIWRGRCHSYGHYDHHTLRRSVATNGFGHRIFLHYMLFAETSVFTVCVSFVKLLQDSDPGHLSQSMLPVLGFGVGS